jgi:hypothetical protein
MQAIEHVEVVVTSRNQLHELLTGAEELLRPKAIAGGDLGILVTRHNPYRYTVALSDSVPFGETHELLQS